MTFPWIEVAAIATAAGASAAWRSANASRQAMARASRPFVWPEWKQWRVRLHNDGPGVALDVRAREFSSTTPKQAKVIVSEVK